MYLGPFASRPLVAARPVQIDIPTVRGAGYTYSNTVLQWSYQWGKQKLVCKRTCLTATVVHHVLDRTAAAGEWKVF